MFQSLRGEFLIAGKPLRDPNFYRSAVLIVEHNEQGAMGLIVNRPSSVTVARALSEHFQLPQTGDLVYIGGPVEPAALFILHNAPHLDENESPVVSDLYVGSSPEVFENVVKAAAEDEADVRFRIYCGCAGWGPGQLEGELDRGDWLHVPASPEQVFSENPYELWDRLIEQTRQSRGFLPGGGGNPEWN